MVESGRREHPDVDLVATADGESLREFLAGEPRATVFHSPEWQDVIRRTYGHECLYWAARVGNRVTGVFPVVAVRYPLLGTKMIAMPFQFHCGLPIAARRDTAALIERAVAEARHRGARFVEIRHHQPVPFLEDMGFAAASSELVSTTTPLEGLRLKQLRKGHREEVRYALRREVELEESASLSDLRTFHRLYLQEGRALGTPRPGWSYFRNMLEVARPHCRLLLARSADGRCLGGLLTLEDATNVFARCSAFSSPEAIMLKVGKALLWRAMEDASKRGRKAFHFGISWAGDSGLIRWKEGWNGSSQPVHQYVLSLRSRPVSGGAYFSGFEWAKAVWRRLPLAIAERVGHRVTGWVC